MSWPSAAPETGIFVSICITLYLDFWSKVASNLNAVSILIVWRMLKEEIPQLVIPHVVGKEITSKLCSPYPTKVVLDILALCSLGPGTLHHTPTSAMGLGPCATLAQQGNMAMGQWLSTPPSSRLTACPFERVHFHVGKMAEDPVWHDLRSLPHHQRLTLTGLLAHWGWGALRSCAEQQEDCLPALHWDFLQNKCH